MPDSTPSSAELENWEILCSFLPPGWAEQAYQSGAIVRKRYNSDPAVVLRILLLHLATGCSLAETAARATASGLAQTSAVAVFKRLRWAEPWLRWLARQMRAPADVPMPTMGRRLRAVDATSVSEPGSTGSDWKVHYAVNLADLECDFFQITGIKEGGETFRRFPISKGDIMVGDRVYAAPPGISHTVHAGGDVIVRLNRTALPVYDEGGQRLVLLPLVRSIPDSTRQEWRAYVQDPRGGWITGRLIILRRSEEAARWACKRMQRRAQRSREEVSAEALEFANYFMVWTSLPTVFEKDQVLECYRLRWQIELVFKRMKSILGLGHLPKHDPQSAKAWLEGKLFVGLLIEKMIHAANSISPWGYPLGRTP